METQIPSIDPNSRILYCPGRDVAYLGDYLLEAAMVLLSDDIRLDEMVRHGATMQGIQNMVLRITLAVHAKTLQAGSWQEAFVDNPELQRFEVDYVSEREVLALLGKLFLSSVWNGKRSANKASADGKTFFSITDMGELMGLMARKFLDGSFKEVLDDIDGARTEFYKELRDKMKERAARNAIQAAALAAE
jgi:hypothetical protein